MLETGVKNGIEAISGASAGAIIAALIAVGMPIDRFREKLLSTNFKDLLGTTIGDIAKTLKPGTHNEIGVSFFTRDGAGILALVRNNIEETIKEFMQQNENELRLRQAEDEELSHFIHKMESNHVKITFADLALLHKYWPQQFINLTIPAVRHADGKLQIFNAKNTPHVEIALVCRASASIPVLLEPVEIDLEDGSEPQKYVDAGIFDNLPSEYFDSDENGDFQPNQKPEQTLIFAFGEGFDNQKNSVYKALYGSRWDEVLNEEFLSAIYENTGFLLLEKLKDNPLLALDKLGSLLKPALREVLSLFIATATTVDERKLYLRVAELIEQGSEKLVASIEKKPDNYPKLFSDQAILDLKALGNYLLESLKPLIYEAGFIDIICRNQLPSLLADLNPGYKSTAQKEMGYQKIRSQYPLRTIEMRVGNIKTNDFKTATKHARVMDALGYLDTVNHITNHELHDPDLFNAEGFYISFVKNFIKIYKTILNNTADNLTANPLLNKIRIQKQALINKDEAVFSRHIYQLIKESVEKKLDSHAAFALLLTVEYGSHILTAEQLHEEINAKKGSYNQSWLYTYFPAKPLAAKALEKKEQHCEKEKKSSSLSF